jgi:hypothetical protein
MVKAGAWIYADLSQATVAHRCERRINLAGHPATRYVATGPLDRTLTMSADNMPWSNTAPRIAVFISRFDETVVPPDDRTGLQEDYVVQKLADQMPVRIAGQRVNADILRIEDKMTRVAFGCLSVTVPGKAGTPTKIDVCRSNGSRMDGDLVLQQARVIAIHDMPAINP